MRQDRDLKSLDGLIAELGGADYGVQSKGPCGLLIEHLQAARRDLLGSMPGECSMSLRQAKEFVGCIVDQGARAKTRQILESLLAS